MWWWWWWWRSKAIEMWFHGLPNLYKRTTFYLFLSLHSAPEELTWVGSVPFAKNRLVERIACKGTRCLNTAMLVSPHFKEFRCLHRNVSGFALSILSPPWLLEWPSPEKRPEFYLSYIKLQWQFTFPQRGSFGIIHKGSLCIQKSWSPVPLLPAMQEIQGNMDDVLSGNDLRDDEKDKRYFQLQNRYLALSLLTGFIASVY